MAKYITLDNLKVFLNQMRTGGFVANDKNDKDENGNDIMNSGFGMVKLGYEYPENGYTEEINKFISDFSEIEALKPIQPPADASAEQLDDYNKKLEEWETKVKNWESSFNAINGSLSKTYSRVELDESGKAYVKLNDIVYDTDIPGEVKTLSNLGDIPKGTTVNELKGKTYTQLFNDILFPTDNNIKANGVGVSGFNINISSRIVEMGTDIAIISNEGKLEQGYWDKYNGNAKDGGIRVIGEETDRNYFINGPGINSTAKNLTVNDPIIGKKYGKCGNCVYKVTIEHNAGTDNPKNNKGDYIDLSLKECQTIADAMKAGSKTASITVNVTLPCWASGSNGLEKLKLVSWDSEGKMEMSNDAGREFPAHTKANPSQFEIPRKMTKMEVFNTQNNSWTIPNDIADWELSNIKKTINGIECDYYRYTYTNEDRGKVKIKIYF